MTSPSHVLLDTSLTYLFPLSETNPSWSKILFNGNLIDFFKSYFKVIVSNSSLSFYGNFISYWNTSLKNKSDEFHLIFITGHMLSGCGILFCVHLPVNVSWFVCFRVDTSRMAQWKRAGPITQRSVDRNHVLLTIFSCCWVSDALIRNFASILL